MLANLNLFATRGRAACSPCLCNCHVGGRGRARIQCNGRCCSANREEGADAVYTRLGGYYGAGMRYMLAGLAFRS